MSRFTAEEITSPIFDGTVEPSFFSRLNAYFSGVAASNRPAPLRKAIAHLQGQGLPYKTARFLTDEAQGFMQHELDTYLFARAMKYSQDKTAPYIVNEIRWTPAAYLGVHIISPAISLHTDPELMAPLRQQFKQELAAFIKQHPDMFIKEQRDINSAPHVYTPKGPARYG